MPHAIADEDWPLFRRLMRDYKAGRLTRRPKAEGRPRVRGGRGLKLGRTVEFIEEGTKGLIVRLQGPKGEEVPVGSPFEVYNRFGDLNDGKDVLYATIAGGKEIVQSRC